MDRLGFLNFQKGVMIALILTGHFMQFYVYMGSEAYWLDPVYKGLYIFVFAYYMAVNGYIASLNLTDLKFSEVLSFKFVQYLMPLVFWCALIFVSAPVFTYFGSQPLSPIKAVWLNLNGYWLLWSDVICIFLIRVLRFIHVKPAVSIIVSMVVVFLIPNGDKLNLLSMVKYAYLGVAAGYLMGVYKIDFTPKWWMVLLMLPVCAVVYVYWTMETYIYLNRLNYLDPEKRKDVMLMFAGTLSFSFVAFWLLKKVYPVICGAPLLMGGVLALAKLNSVVILFEVFFYYAVNHGQLVRSGNYVIDIVIACIGTIAAISLIPQTFGVIKPGTWLFRFIWGTTTSMGDVAKPAKAVSA